MKDPRRVRERIVKTLDLADVMISYKVEFKFDPKAMREVQFHCTFHGADRKPSARLYRDTNSCYCWYCKKSWDPFSFIMEKEGLGYWQALNFITDKYRINTDDIPDIDFEFGTDARIVSEDAIEFMFVKNRVMAQKKKLEFERYRMLCGAYLLLSMQKIKGSPIKEGVTMLMEKLDHI